MAKYKLYLSNSKIQVFMNCKKKYKHKYIEKLNTGERISSKYLSFGNSIHMTLAQFNNITNPQYRTLDNLHKLLRKNWSRDGYESIEEEREYGLKALEMLTNYFKDPKDQGKENLVVEEMIKQEVDNRYVLAGKLDKVYRRHDNLIETMDYKTGNTIEQFNKLQLPIYALLTKEKLGYYPDTISYYYLAHNIKTEMEVTKELIDEAIKILEDVYQQLYTERAFPPSPSEYCQNTCEYFEHCNDAKDHNSIVVKILKTLDENNDIDTVF